MLIGKSGSALKAINIDGIQLLHKIDPRLKHVYLQVDASGQIVLKSRGRVNRHIEAFVRSRREWIERQKALASLRPVMQIGKELLLMGRCIDIETLGGFARPANTPDALKRQYDAYYRMQAETYLTRRVEAYAQQMEVRFNGVRFRKMKRRWGSCSREGTITFNTLLMQCTAEQIDYTVVHELAHLVHFNHSPAFHDLIAHYLPEHRQIRKSMRAVWPLYY